MRKCLTIVLIFLPSIVSLLYPAGEYYGLWDQLTGRKFAVEGLSRLKSAAGYPGSWIYDDDQDKTVFDALERRISKHTKEAKIKKALANGHKPSLITIGGSPIILSGVPNEWPEVDKRVYLSSHPVMYIFGVQRNPNGTSNGKGDRVCTIADLEKWLQEEVDNRKFYFGIVVVTLISIVILFLRQSIFEYRRDR